MVTIVMAVFNGAKYLERQLQTIASQTYKDWKLVVRDDGSTDKTINILKDFSKRFGGRVCILETGKPSGSAKNNFAILLGEVSGDDYVMCCDQDDIWGPDKIKITLDKMLSLEEKFGKNYPILVHSDVEVVDELGDMIAGSMFGYSNLPAVETLGQLLVQNNVTGCTMMLNRAALKPIAPFLKGDKVVMHDYFAALYVKVFGCVYVIEKPLIKYRQHGDNSVGAKAGNSKSYLIGRLFRGKKQYVSEMENNRVQAEFFLECFGNDMKQKNKTEQYALIEGYAALKDKRYWQRIVFYFKNHVWKYGLVRRIMQFIWG